MRITLTALLYALACVVVPIAWGVVIVRASTAIETRLRRRRNEDIPPIEYHI